MAEANPIETLADELIEERFKGHTVEPNVRAELRKDAVERANQYLLRKAIEQLSHNDAVVVEAMLARGERPEEAWRYIRNSMRSALGGDRKFYTFFNQASGDFRRVYLTT
jgi:hypothetical protein